MKQQLESAVQSVVMDLYGQESHIELTRPEEQFGDYATNVALQLAGKLGRPPREIAEEVASKLLSDSSDQLRSVDVAGPGFINMTLSDQSLMRASKLRVSKTLEGQTIVAEYSDPNPFKVLHAGHLYTSVVGDSIANLLELAGASVHRVNFGGDVGLHVGKTMWAILERLGGENPDKLATLPEEQRSEWMADAYVAGTTAYEENETAKAEIIALNKRVYSLHTENDHESAFAQIYWTCREWSYQYFDEFYGRIGSKFEKYYPESQTAPLGLATVKAHIGSVYSESDGAVIFDGEAHGLHTRVFVNSEGLPTYESKDVGLIMKKWEEYHFDQSIIITGNDIVEYMKVVLKSIEQFMPELPARTRHLTHGIVKLEGGTKMSSRKGNFLRAVDVLSAAADANKALNNQDNEETVLGAVKYAFLKNRIGGDLIYDAQESVSLEGNSGPYLQYAYARARSIIRKSEIESSEEAGELQSGERSLVRKISEYPEVIDRATSELMPHHICGYLYELAQTFNRFYEHNRVIGDEREAFRLGLVQRYADTLKSGLNILGIIAPEKM